MIVRGTPEEPQTTLASMMLETSFAKFVTSMAAFNEETAPSRLFRRCDVVAMIETQGSYEGTVWPLLL